MCKHLRKSLKVSSFSWGVAQGQSICWTCRILGLIPIPHTHTHTNKSCPQPHIYSLHQNIKWGLGCSSAAGVLHSMQEAQAQPQHHRKPCTVMGPSLLSPAVIEQHGQRHRGERVERVYLACTSISQSTIKRWTQSRNSSGNLEAGTKAETMEEWLSWSCLLSWPTTFLIQPLIQTLVEPPKSIINQKKKKKTMPPRLT